MSKAMTLRLVFLSHLLLLLPACSQVAVTERRQFNLVPSSMMHSMSLQSYNEFLSQNKLGSDAQQSEMVKRVGNKIQVAVQQYYTINSLPDPSEGYEWQFNLVEDPSVNAWCMPGGKVVVNTGLLPVAKGEAGLAVVMGHEIAHAIAKHGAERMTQGLIVEFGGKALSYAMESRPEQTRNLFMKSYGVGTQYGVLLPYSRVHEKEADHMGLIFLAIAGYDPHEAVTFWQRMSDANKDKASPMEIMSTHPSDSTRIRKIKELLPEAMKYYKPAK
jgi:predicted Zn-dependent protease